MREGTALARSAEHVEHVQQEQKEQTELKAEIISSAQEQRRALFFNIYTTKVVEFFRTSGLKYADYIPVVSLVTATMESHRGISMDGERVLTPFERMQKAELVASTALYYLTLVGDSPEHFLYGLYSAGLTVSVGVDAFAKQIWPELNRKAKAWSEKNGKPLIDPDSMKALLLKIWKMKGQKHD